jgi:hypothetical protein
MDSLPQRNQSAALKNTRSELYFDSFFLTSPSFGLTQRPKTSKYKESSYLTKVTPKAIPQDREKLYEENLYLKAKSNQLLEENLQLKTKIKVFEDNKNETKDPSVTLMNNLKKKIKELNNKALEKENLINNLKRNIKNTRINELEKLVQTYYEECKRLMDHLNEFSKSNGVSKDYLEYEKQLYDKNQVINALKKADKERMVEINKLKDDIEFLKGKNEKYAEIPKTSPREWKNACIDCEKFKKKYKKIKFDQENLQSLKSQEIEDLKALYSESLSKSQHLEVQISDQLKLIESLHQKLSILKNTFKPPEILLKTEIFNKKQKLKNPPRLFCKMSQIIKSKYILPDVFLSLLDKNSIGCIDPEELQDGLTFKGKKVKSKHIIEIMKLIGCENRNIPIKLLEEWYEKYEYDPYYPSSDDDNKLLNTNQLNDIKLAQDSGPNSSKKLETKSMQTDIEIIIPYQRPDTYSIQLRIKYQDLLDQIRTKMRTSIEVFDEFLNNEFFIENDKFKNFLSLEGIETTDEFINELSKGKLVCDLNYFKMLLQEDQNFFSDNDV